MLMAGCACHSAGTEKLRAAERRRRHLEGIRYRREPMYRMERALARLALSALTLSA